MLIEEAEAAASFFPTANEVVRAVQFVRENPAVVLGVVVGITSLSVASYFEDEEEHEADIQAVASEGPDQEEPPSETPEASSRVEPPRKLSRSRRSSTLLVSGDVSSIAETTSSDTINSNDPATAQGEKQDTEQGVDAVCDKMHKSCSFCNQAKESPEACCDPDWGWFIPTSPDDEHRHHHRHGQEHHDGGAQGA